mmetsp:Transcript_20222/g.32804  ORF Transcript_20222/g.32804 Transcript_20222/m.32804 type:complete len:217 (-) Transcript_20222:739-1389(-)
MTGSTATMAATNAATNVTSKTAPTKTTTKIAFQEGYIKDEWSQLVEPAYRGIEGRAFLWTGRTPEVGQRTETQVTTAASTNGPAGSWCRLSGVVTDVGPLPTLDEWRSSSISCQQTPIEHQESLRDDVLSRFGTLHGQQVTSYAFLNFDFYDRQEELPFKRGRVYKVTHEADETKSFFWCVSSIEDVTDDLPCCEEYPEAFRKWSDGLGLVRRVSF